MDWGYGRGSSLVLGRLTTTRSMSLSQPPQEPSPTRVTKPPPYDQLRCHE